MEELIPRHRTDTPAVGAGNFSVIQFFKDGSGERVVSRVAVTVAMDKAKFCCTSVGASLGTTTRVVIEHDGDAIVLEWKFGEGFTFPPEFVGREWAQD